MSDFIRDVPVIINCRDRVIDLVNLVAWLEKAGHENITLLDNDSTWEPLLTYYEQTPHEVVRLEENLGSRALWRSGRVPGTEFVYSDPDVLPTEECPLDVVEYLHDLLGRFSHPKAGLGLMLDDTPHFQSIGWERSLVSDSRMLEPGVFDSLVDTCFALYRPHTTHSLLALRTAAPYLCRHTPWYRIADPTEEEQYYLARAIKGPLGSSWADGRQ